MEEEIDERIHSQELLKPKFRLKYQTTEFIYKALDMAENQILELLEKIEKMEKLEKENRRLQSLSKIGISNIREKRKK